MNPDKLSNRNSTNFPYACYEALKGAKISDDLKYLKYYQQLTHYYATEVLPKTQLRGLLIYYPMGMGKSISAASIALHYALSMGREVVFIMAKSIQENMRAAIKQTIRLRSQYDPEYRIGKLDDTDLNAYIDKNITFLTSNAGNLSKKLYEISYPRGIDPTAKYGKVVQTEPSLNGKTILVDEAHDLFLAISNGSKNAIALYNLVMGSPDCLAFFFTGTPISSNVFEVVPCFNMIARHEIFPTIYADFYKYFVRDGRITNKGKFQNRIMGMVSYANFNTKTAEGQNVNFPRSSDIIVRRVPMSVHQYSMYRQARDKEIAESKVVFGAPAVAAMTKPKMGFVSSYRQKSRQLGNYCPPPTMTWRRFSDINPDDIKGKDIWAPKLEQMLRDIESHGGSNGRGAIGIVYSQFVGIGGLGSAGKYLELNGWKIYHEQSTARNLLLTKETTVLLEPGEADGEEATSADISKESAAPETTASETTGGRVSKVPKTQQSGSKYHSKAKSSRRRITFHNRRLTKAYRIEYPFDADDINDETTGLLAQMEHLKEYHPPWLKDAEKAAAEEMIEEIFTSTYSFGLSLHNQQIKDDFEKAIIEEVRSITPYIHRVPQAVLDEERHAAALIQQSQASTTVPQQPSMTVTSTPLNINIGGILHPVVFNVVDHDEGRSIQFRQVLGDGVVAPGPIVEIPRDSPYYDYPYLHYYLADMTPDKLGVSEDQAIGIDEAMRLAAANREAQYDEVRNRAQEDYGVNIGPYQGYIPETVQVNVSQHIALQDDIAHTATVINPTDESVLRVVDVPVGDIYRDMYQDVYQQEQFAAPQQYTPQEQQYDTFQYTGSAKKADTDHTTQNNSRRKTLADGAMDRPRGRSGPSDAAQGRRSEHIYAIISGSVEPEMRDKIVRVFRSDENKYGGIIDCLLLSSTGAQGLDLKNVRYEIALEPYWNLGRLNQFFARGDRNGSHLALDEADRTVDKYVYLAIRPDPEAPLLEGEEAITTDEDLYAVGTANQRLIDDFLEAEREVAIDCMMAAQDPAKCKMCMPTGSRLFFDDLDKDIVAADNCMPIASTKIEAKEAIVNGVKYYYNEDPTKVLGVRVFGYDEGVKSYRELAGDDPVVLEIVEKING